MLGLRAAVGHAFIQTMGDMVEQTADAGQSPGGDRSTGELVKQLSEQVSVLIRDELKLAQMEMTRKGKQAGVGAGLLGAAGWWPCTAWAA
jgi:Putative Actinobacterial Holin-X, holin superfamily III